MAGCFSTMIANLWRSVLRLLLRAPCSFKRSRWADLGLIGPESVLRGTYHIQSLIIWQCPDAFRKRTTVINWTQLFCNIHLWKFKYSETPAALCSLASRAAQRFTRRGRCRDSSTSRCSFSIMCAPSYHTATIRAPATSSSEKYKTWTEVMGTFVVRRLLSKRICASTDFLEKWPPLFLAYVCSFLLPLGCKLGCPMVELMRIWRPWRQCHE